MRVLPWLRVVKNSFRGLCFARVGRLPPRLQAFRRALQFDPQNKLARDGFWEVHRSLDLNAVANDAQTLALVDLDLCLDRAGALLVQGKPNETQLHEAHQLLDLVQRLRPQLRPPIDYWRAVAHTHGRQYEDAADELSRLLDPVHYGRDNPQRHAVLLPAWQMALTLSEELRRRVGTAQLAQPGRRMEAIAVVERRLAENNDDQAAWGLKRLLYSELTVDEYRQAMGDQPAPPGEGPPVFDYNYVQQLGLALIDDDKQWQRGGEYCAWRPTACPTRGRRCFCRSPRRSRRRASPKRPGTTWSWPSAPAGRSGPRTSATPNGKRTSPRSSTRRNGDGGRRPRRGRRELSPVRRVGAERRRDAADAGRPARAQGRSAFGLARHGAGVALQPQGQGPDRPQRPILLLRDAGSSCKPGSTRCTTASTSTTACGGRGRCWRIGG